MVAAHTVGYAPTQTRSHNVLIGYIAWLFGIFGAHRFYIGKWISGLVYLLTGGLFFVGVVYDILTLNDQIHNTHLER